MTKSRHNPKYKIKLQNQISKDIKSKKFTSKFTKLQRQIIIRKRFCYF